MLSAAGFPSPGGGRVREGVAKYICERSELLIELRVS